MVENYDDIFAFVWRSRGYTEEEIKRIYQWRVTDKLDDVATWNKMVEAGIAR